MMHRPLLRMIILELWLLQAIIYFLLLCCIEHSFTGRRHAAGGFQLFLEVCHIHFFVFCNYFTQHFFLPHGVVFIRPEFPVAPCAVLLQRHLLGLCLLLFLLLFLLGFLRAFGFLPPCARTCNPCCALIFYH